MKRFLNALLLAFVVRIQVPVESVEPVLELSAAQVIQINCALNMEYKIVPNKVSIPLLSH